ncbi:hypothetical protein YC2023_076510 [Brassica napus]
MANAHVAMGKRWHCLSKAYNVGLFARLTQNSNSNLKLTHAFLGFFFCPIHPTSSYNSRKCHQNFFLSENDIFTLSPSSSSSNYKIVIVINTPTTMNNQFESLNAPKIDLHSLFLTYSGWLEKTLCAKEVISLTTYAEVVK